MTLHLYSDILGTNQYLWLEEKTDEEYPKSSRGGRGGRGGRWSNKRPLIQGGDIRHSGRSWSQIVEGESNTPQYAEEWASS